MNRWLLDTAGRVVALAMLVLMVSVASANTVKGVRVTQDPDGVNIVLDLTAPPDYKFAMASRSATTDKLWVDLKQGKLKGALKKDGLSESFVESVRTGQHADKLRLVFDLSTKIKKPVVKALSPAGQYGHRLLLKLATVQPVTKPAKVAAETAAKPASKPPAKVPLRDILIAIDAGHGGKDPGAIGPGGVREKDVVLAIAKELKRLIDKEKGFKAVMTRSNDRYISLRGRTKLARKYDADLFVSIHADAFTNPQANGASVWVLSDRGATSEMGRWLANKERIADELLRGQEAEVSDDVSSVLLDLTMHKAKEYSRTVGGYIHREIASFAKMHKRRVEKAGFVVLKTPGRPSILVETGFISNPGEARKLKTASYRKKMANAIYRGVKKHFWEIPPPNTHVMAWKRENASKIYVVTRGDTLSGIASRKGVTLVALKKANGLKSNGIRIGQKLKIPAS